MYTRFAQTIFIDESLTTVTMTALGVWLQVLGAAAAAWCTSSVTSASSCPDSGKIRDTLMPLKRLLILHEMMIDTCFPLYCHGRIQEFELRGRPSPLPSPSFPLLSPPLPLINRAP